MKSIFYSICFLLFPFIGFSQVNDSINILFNSEWKIVDYGLHPLQDTLKLSRYNRKKDSISFRKFKDSLIKSKKLGSKTITQLKKYKYRNYYGEFIAFDSISNSNYYLRSSCITGATFYDVKEFYLNKNKIFIQYSKSQFSSHSPKTEHKYWYNIVVWNEQNIILEKIK